MTRGTSVVLVAALLIASSPRPEALSVTLIPTTLQEVAVTLVADAEAFGDFYDCPTIGGRTCTHPRAVAITVRNLDTGEVASVNGDVLMTSASAVKAVWVAAAVHEMGVPSVVPYAEPIFIYSSNTAGSAVIDMLGPMCYAGVDRLNTIVGSDFDMDDIILNAWYDCRAALETKPPWASNRVTTNALARFWADLADGRLLDASSTEQVLAWASLERDHAHDLLTARLPPGSMVSYKAGWMGASQGSRISGGLITAPDGTRLAVAVAVRAFSGTYYEGARTWPEYATCVLTYAAMRASHDCGRLGDPPGLTAIDTALVGAPVPARLAGADRFGTSVEVSRATFDPGVAVALIATGHNFPDALTAGAAAGHLGAPVLLVEGDRVPLVVIEELQRLAPRQIVIVGGAAAVSEAVAASLREIAPTSRVAGIDRFETAALLALQVFTEGTPWVYVATGLDWRDALLAAPVAGAQDAPVLLTQPDALPATTRAAIEALQPEHIVIVGGLESVSEAVEAELRLLAPDLQRVAGVDAYATGALLAASFAAPQRVYVATSAIFPDALSGAAAAAFQGVPILLTGRDTASPPTVEVIRSLAPIEVVILGGSAAVSDAVAIQLALASL